MMNWPKPFIHTPCIGLREDTEKIQSEIKPRKKAGEGGCVKGRESFL